MSEDITKLKTLISRYSDNAVTADEERELFDLIENTSREDFENVLTELFEAQPPVFDPERTNMILSKTLNHINSEPIVRKIYPWKRWVAAAAILVVLSLTYLLTTRNKDDKIAETKHEVKSNQDVAAPNKTKATITLADGRIVTLDDVKAGTLAQQGNVNVSKTADGKIIYNGSSTEAAFNTLTNPRGSLVIDMTLTDGSHVWLNAGSSIKYPVAFNGKERKVSMTGEAYFEVAHNTAMPFVVNKGDLNVTVLGTHFNINAYDDEDAIKVTLLEGSVKVGKGNSSSLLRPGEQGILRYAQNDNQIIVSKNVDVNQVMAWRNGIFEFRNTEFPVIMRQVARWYDVEVAYEGTPTNAKFGGGLSMKLSLANLLKLLEGGGLKFKVEGKKVTVIY